MRNIIHNEIFKISGGGTYLVATSRVQFEFDGISAACVSSYLNEHQSDIPGLSLSDLVDKMMLQCRPQDRSYGYKYEESLIGLEVP